MGDCVNLSLNNQTFQTSAVVIGLNPNGPAVQGLTVYGDISATGRMYSADSGLFKMSIPGNGGYQYVMSYSPSPNAQDYIVSVDGILQEAGKSYFVSSNGVITFTENIPVGSTILILANRSILANSTNVPSFKKNFYIATGSATMYPLAYYSNDNSENYLVYLDGVMQSPGEDYIIVNNQIEFAEPPFSGQRILVMSLQNQDGTYAAMTSETNSNFRLSSIPVPSGSLDSQSLVYNSATKVWEGRYILPTTATNGQVLTYNSSQQKWLAATTVVTRGGGIIIKDLPGASTWTVPANVGSIKVHVIGGGGGIGADGGDSVFSVTVNSTPVTVTANGGLRGTASVGGKGGDVSPVAAISNINFTGVGSGIGGTGGSLRVKGSAGTGNSGGYGGGGGGGAGSGGASVNSSMPVGTICWYPVSAAPVGFLECNGAVLSQTAYPSLYTVIGTKFNTGGETSGSFRLPDLRGEFIRGWDNGKGVDSGRTFASRQSDGIRRHNHQYKNSSLTQMRAASALNNLAATSNLDYLEYDYINPSNSSSTSAFVGFRINPTTAGVFSGWAADNLGPFLTIGDNVNSATETRPRNISLLPCIRGSVTDAVSESPGGGGGGSGLGGGGGGASSGVGGSGSGYGGSGNSDASWGEKSGGYGGGAAATGYGAGGGGGYAAFSLDVTPGSTVSVVVGAGGTGGTGGRPGAVIIEW